MSVSIKQISDEFSKGNFASCYEHFADNIRWKIIGDKTVTGKEEVISYCEKMLVEMASSTLTNLNTVAEGNCIVIEGKCDFKEEDNNRQFVSYCDVYQFEDTKVKSITSYCI